ncbi:MAG: GNAT family N-acetyltransferase [Solirubrobacterales bacterium]|nr:GNAT family N-acetyltransferase [Solirubrobacterales bacterium]
MGRRTLDRIMTERMICNRLRPEHLADVTQLMTDPRVARTLWPGDGLPSPRQVADSLRAKVNHWERYGFGLWLLLDRRTGAMVGRGGLQYTYVEGINEIEVGWAIVPERWRQGLATELALACVEVAFNDLELMRLVAFTLPHNIASRRVMEKAGFEFEREIVHAGLDHVLYRRERAGK